MRDQDGSDPQLRFTEGASYPVRTVKLSPVVKIVFDVYVNGERVRRAAYSLR